MRRFYLPDPDWDNKHLLALLLFLAFFYFLICIHPYCIIDCATKQVYGTVENKYVYYDIHYVLINTESGKKQ